MNFKYGHESDSAESATFPKQNYRLDCPTDKVITSSLLNTADLSSININKTLFTGLGLGFS